MKIFTKEIKVTKEAIDINNHVNNVMYVQWMQEAAMSHSKTVGDTVELQKERGYSWVVRTHVVDYIAEVKEGEILHIKTWVEEYKKSACLRRYEFYNALDKLMVKASTVYVCIDVEKKRPIKIPEDINAFYVDGDS